MLVLCDRVVRYVKPDPKGECWRFEGAFDVEDALPTPVWIDRIASFDPRRILFAHNMSVMEP